jgi:acyl carrier protein
LPTILERVKKVTAARLGAKEDAVSATANFTDDLGADSLDLVELIMGLEEEFSTGDKPVKIPDDEAAKIKTVQDAVEYLKAKGITDKDVKPAASTTVPPAVKVPVSAPKSKPEASAASVKKSAPAAGKAASKNTKAK